MLSLRFHNGLILDPRAGALETLAISDGRILSDAPGLREVDLEGYALLPGLIDLHGDGFERHLAPRRGALRTTEEGLLALDAELAAAGITTAILAQFWSWEGGMRSPDFARELARALTATGDRLRTDMQIQLRLETHMIDDFPAVEAFIAETGIRYVVFNDHLPHQRLAEGRRPPRLTGQALKSGRNPEAHLRLMQDLHARSAEVPARLAALSRALIARGVTLGSHDDHSPADRHAARAMGVRIAEFPETAEAAEAAREQGDPIILGAPNVMRGASHAGNVSARDLIADGLCDALVSDYHYPSLKAAALDLAGGVSPALAPVWDRVSARPAEMLGLSDRGTLAPGQRADLVVLDQVTGQVAASFSGGVVSFLGGAFAERLLG
ncbi:alpha-D-ribose 1-methylphosphonate 5-triphosphate diphosphatase [Dinoroseobacter sp. S124A]|uniref:alpha-D-ribose 1-methylphosphonate 5-triphosphate diphosphatase n=1 Tax=Dinoroseobacter sp. S124A TaxID=3415128 RepID=UPI003C7C75CB